MYISQKPYTLAGFEPGIYSSVGGHNDHYATPPEHCLLWVVLLKIVKVAQFFGYFFPRYKFWQNMDWAAFWAIFSKTHLFTLVGSSSSSSNNGSTS
jgi:hypothetical protein